MRCISPKFSVPLMVSYTSDRESFRKCKNDIHFLYHHGSLMGLTNNLPKQKVLQCFSSSMLLNSRM